MDDWGLPPEYYAHKASNLTRRSLEKMLRDARKKLAYHGRRSFMGKQALKAIQAAEAEMRRRGHVLPESP